MDFTEDFALIQGALLTIQRREGLLENLSQEVPDDRKKILSVVDALKHKVCIDYKESAEENADQRLRRIQLYLLLNTDLNIQAELTEDSNCGHLVDSAPRLSKDLLIELVWGLSLQKYLSETVIFCPPVLSDELLDMVTFKIRYSNPSLALPWLIEFVKALYVKMLMLEDSAEKQSFKFDLKCIKPKLFTHYKLLLDLLSNPESKMFCSLNANELHQHAGRVAHKILLLLNSCIQYHLHPPVEDPNILDNYNMSLKFDYSRWNKADNALDGLKFMKKVNNELFSACVKNLNCITVDLWMYWVECDSVYENDNRSLQNDIAESMFVSLESVKEFQKLGNESIYFKDLIPMLSSMAVKPFNEDDEIRAANLEEILKNVSNKNKSQNKWFKALLMFDNAFSNSDCVECIKNNIHVVTYDDVNVIYKNIFSLLDNKLVVDEHIAVSLKNIALDAVKYLPLNEQLEIMNVFLRDASNKSVLLTKEFNTNITEVFNKAANIPDKIEEEFVSDFIYLTLQSPEDVVRKLLFEGLTNRNHGMLMMDVLKALWPLREFPGHSPEGGNLLVQLIQELMLRRSWSEAEETNFIHLVVTLINGTVVSGDTFSSTCLLPTLHSSFIASNWTALTQWLRTLRVFVDGTVESNSISNKAAVLVVLAQVLEVSRQQLFTFSAKAVAVREETVNLIEIVIDTVLSEKTEADKQIKWLQNVLKLVLSPVDLFYFGKVWRQFYAEPPAQVDLEVWLLHGRTLEERSIKQLIGETISAESIREAVLPVLLQILPSCTSTEWKTVSRGVKDSMGVLVEEDPVLFLFDIFADVILLLSTLVTKESEESTFENECAFSCLDSCARNFGSIIKEEILPHLKLMPTLAGVTIFQKCVHVFETLPSCVEQSCSSTLMNILVDIMTYTFASVQPTIDSQLDDRKEKVNHWLRLSVIKDLGTSIHMIKNKKTRGALSAKLSTNLTSLYV